MTCASEVLASHVAARSLTHTRDTVIWLGAGSQRFCCVEASRLSAYLIPAIAVGLPSLVSSVAKLVAVLRARDITINVRSWWR
jgi:hypothetical protein